jgi:hypothetical protein
VLTSVSAGVTRFLVTVFAQRSGVSIRDSEVPLAELITETGWVSRAIPSSRDGRDL